MYLQRVSRKEALSTVSKDKAEYSLDITSPVGSLKGIGPKKCEALRKLGIYTLEDSLYSYPRSYEDLRNPVNVCDCTDSSKVLITATVLLVNRGNGYGRKRTLHVLAEDSTGRLEILFFMAGYMQNAFKVGEKYNFFGKVKVENGRVTMFHPSFSLYNEASRGIFPVYPLVKGISQKDRRFISESALQTCYKMRESLPHSVINKEKLCSNAFALQNIHFPENDDSYRAAKYRMVFEELFGLKTALALSSAAKDSRGIRIISDMALRFADSLPYRLTNAQRNALNDVLKDMHSNKCMNRLIQGDVGSGKTAVAMCAICEAVFAGFQALFMAPTDILAHQHYNTLKSAFKDLDVNIILLTSSISGKERKKALDDISNGNAQVIVGTHALLSDSVKYCNAGLVITDEQHRFGVSQREKLSAKGDRPDVIVMTATPIPRTLAVVLFADLDISVIDELPPGRKPVKTYKFNDNERADAYRILFDEVSKGHQAYIVAPFIEDSESLNGRSAESLYEAFKRKHPDISCGLLHGELSQADKDAVMKDFADNKISVLICTVVIEVGIDVPNASVMLIENSERFGLAQMHQLRGRVGRGSSESFCLICTGEESEVSEIRAEILCSTSDGFVIAEKDLEIRGPGEFFGFRQHGLPQLVFTDPVKHEKIAKKANEAALALLNEDPLLSKPENKDFYDIIKKKYIKVDNLTL